VSAGAGLTLSVELVGIPGSGKSRRARKLTERLGDRGVTVGQPQAPLAPAVPTVRRLARKARACGATVVTEPGTAARVGLGVLRSGQPGAGQALGRVVQWLVAEDVAIRAARRPGVSIVDEGLVQALWSIGLRGDVRPVLAALDAAPRRAPADLLVVVRVPPELALARLAVRASRHSRTQLLDESERLAELERGARLLDELVVWWSGRWPDRSVTTLDGAHDDAADHDVLLDRISAAPAAGRRLPG
jgi:thymidylate kinase